MGGQSIKLADFLKEVLELGRDDVFKVDVKDSFSFFNTEKAIEEKVLAFFTDYKHNGRFVNVEITENKGGNRGGGRRRDRKRDGRRRDDKPRGERRSRRSNTSESKGDRRGRRSDSPKPRRSNSPSDRPRRSRRR